MTRNHLFWRGSLLETQTSPRRFASILQSASSLEFSSNPIEANPLRFYSLHRAWSLVQTPLRQSASGLQFDRAWSLIRGFFWRFDLRLEYDSRIFLESDLSLESDSKVFKEI